MLTLVANYLLCIESFARMATLNCERSGPHPAKPSRDALAECVGGDNRPIFLNRTNVKSLDVAQVGEMLYYFSAGFLTFKQSDFTSCLLTGQSFLISRLFRVASTGKRQRGVGDPDVEGCVCFSHCLADGDTSPGDGA